MHITSAVTTYQLGMAGAVRFAQYMAQGCVPAIIQVDAALALDGWGLLLLCRLPAHVHWKFWQFEPQTNTNLHMSFSCYIWCYGALQAW
jgi:hypothetical protein